MKLPIDKYSLKARTIPAIVSTVVPIFVFCHFYVSPELIGFYEGLKKFSLVGDVTLTSIIMFYLSQYSRLIGKEIFEKKYFKGDKYMPTTEFLLYSDEEYSVDFKSLIAKKINKDFKLVLNKKDEELNDEMESRRKIAEAVSLIRKKLFENTFLLQHNIEYGAMRNTIGGSVIGVLICIINIIFFKYVSNNKIAFNISMSFLIIYTIIIGFSKFIIDSYGKSYARILIREYMSK